MAQVQAGAQVSAVNVRNPRADEPGMLRAAVLAMMETVDVPISIDYQAEASRRRSPSSGKALVIR